MTGLRWQPGQRVRDPPSPGGYIDLSEQAVRSPSRYPVADLARTVALVDALRQACDDAGAARLVPDLLRDLHAASSGPDRQTALRLLCDVAFIASSIVRNLGHPAEASLGAERCRDAAQAAEDPLLLGYAAYARASHRPTARSAGA